jgi:EAL domain-containing protein (putative c-di-GMP-specific phosphodiesterase class I)
MAFQPIVDLEERRIFAYEALVRGVRGEPALSVLPRGDEASRYDFDQHCRVKAIELAVALGLPATGARLSVNFFPNAVYDSSLCLEKTLETSQRLGLAPERLILEVTEVEEVRDYEHLNEIIHSHRQHGFLTAIDDFGSGYAGLSLLAKFQPDILKIDHELTRNVDSNHVSATIISAILSACRALNIDVIAEGVETAGEMATLRGLGVRYFQGYYFGRPAFEALPAWPPIAETASLAVAPHAAGIAPHKLGI